MYLSGKFKTLFFILFIFFASCHAIDKYEVQFEGIDHEKILKLLYSTSQLVLLKNSPPTTSMGLKKRAENDIKNFIKVLHSQAYYNAKINLEFNFDDEPAIVIVKIDPGVIYPLAEFQILPEPGTQGTFRYSEVTPKSIGVTLEAPAVTTIIVEAENALQQLMECKGYPYARIAQKTIIADQTQKNISATFFADSGAQYKFGKTNIIGRDRVRNKFFQKHIFWDEGDVYSPTKMRRTQNELELSGLFSSVTVVIPEKPPADDKLPITIEVKESKARTIGLGVNYETERGIGATANWTHRNLTGIGDRLGIRTGLWGNKQYGEITYIQPDFGRRKQDLIWSADYLHERDAGYSSRSYSLSTILARQVNKSLTYSYGLMYKHLIDSNIHERKQHEMQSPGDEIFNLFKTPIFIYWNQSNNILDPTEGYRLKIKSIPTYKFLGSQIFYSINVLTGSCYLPLDRAKNYTVAFQSTFGFIPGPCKTRIPRSELFDAGTDSLLRGYKYQTVSPLDNENKPTGGRSMMIYSLEYRIKMSRELGGIIFYDFGNVYSSRTPRLNRKILQSTGLGLRYFTPVGPIRIDLAFPLNPRKHVDKSHYQVYLSVGQTF